MAWMKQSGRVWMPGLGGISVSAAALGGEAVVDGAQDLAHRQAETLDVGAAEVQQFHGAPLWSGGRGRRPREEKRTAGGRRAARPPSGASTR